jgi:hypothetical protein
VAEVQYAFCERVTAGPTSPWHIRQLTDKGKKLGGGADTPSLCGSKMAWDVNVDITEHHLGHSCKECVRLYRERSKS